MFGIIKFHKYVFGREFTIWTDHKPLLGLLQEGKPIPPMASSRVQRWGLKLAAYNYHLRYRAGKEHGNADAMSRLPLRETVSQEEIPGEVVLALEQLDSSPITANKIRRETGRDPVLSRVRTWVSQGWPTSIEGLKKESWYKDVQVYARRRTELSVQDGCILWGNRVVVPPKYRKTLTQVVHEGHQGIGKMKALARGFMWWPGMDDQLETAVKGCDACQVQGKLPAKSPLCPWEWPDQPWSRLHIDYAGPVQGKMLLIIVDAFSKWIDVHVVSSATTQSTTEKLRESMATHGIPDSIVSDNGSCFTSAEVHSFCTSNGIKHIRVSPYHPSSNGLAERAVQTIKSGLSKMKEGTLAESLFRFLTTYRNTPHATTGISPAELLLKRRRKTLFDLLHPNISDRVRLKQRAQKTYHDNHCRLRTFGEGQRVYIRNFGAGPAWIPATVTTLTGPLSVECLLDDGRVAKRHFDHVKSRITGHTYNSREETRELSGANDTQQDSPIDGGESGVEAPSEFEPARDLESTAAEVDPQSQSEQELPASTSVETSRTPPTVATTQGQSGPVEPEVPLRRSSRTRKTPKKLDL